VILKSREEEMKSGQVMVMKRLLVGRKREGEG